MHCPKCKQKLILGKSKRYETLVEHCSDPNKYYYEAPPLREAFYCKTKRCTNNDKHIFWNMYGDVHIGRNWWQKLLMKFGYYKFKSKNVDNAIFID